jgi:hypothetical protein
MFNHPTPVSIHSVRRSQSKVNMRNLVKIVVVIALVSALPASAQQEKGDVELQFTGAILSKVGSNSTTSGFIQAKTGYYFTDRLELGAFPSLTFESGTTTFGLGAFATYSFLAANATMVPYLGGQYYKSDLSLAEDRGWAGFNGGVKFFFNRKTAFDVSGNYLFTLNEIGSNIILLQVGLSFML